MLKKLTINFSIVAGLLAACAQTTAPTTPPANQMQAVKPVLATEPKGDLRIGTGLNLPSSMMVAVGQTGYNMVAYGAGEMLMRLSPQLKLEPWLAETVTPTDASTWQVKLRKGVLFHDGSELKAQDVADSFKRSWENLAGATTFISKDTKVLVSDDYTLLFVTPKPQGNFPFALANWNFVVAKPAVNEISIMTGMYRPVKLEKDQEFTLEHFAKHWQGGGMLKRVIIKKIPDANARMLALQSGDLDMLTNVAPDIAAGLPADIEQRSVGGTRMHFVILNHTKAPFNDKKVREAVSAVVDRAALLKATLNGQGAVAVNLYPPSTGIEQVPAQRTDIEAAKKLLDEAGWSLNNGVREKEGKKLAFTIHTYPGRPELTQMAVVMQSQLKAAGIEVKVDEVKDIAVQIKDGDFQASMFSIGIQADPQYVPGVTLVKGGSFNYGGYSNTNMEALFEQLKIEGDLAKRQSIAKQIQEVVKTDTPNLYLAIPPLITAYKKGKVTGYIQHPDDLYIIHKELGVN